MSAAEQYQIIDRSITLIAKHLKENPMFQAPQGFFSFTPEEIEVNHTKNNPQNLKRISDSKPKLERTLDECFQFVDALHMYKSMEDYHEFLQPSDWLALGMATTFETYKEREPLCTRFEPTTDVFFLLEGNVHVLLKLKVDLDQVVISETPKIPPGICFGDVGVLFKEKRYPGTILFIDRPHVFL